MISEDWRSFFEGSVSLLGGTRDAEYVPECVRLVGLRVAADRKHVSVFVPAAVGARTMSNLADNAQIAITASHPPDHRTAQLKGRALRQGLASAEDQAWVERYVLGLSLVLEVVGLPASVVQRLNHLPCQRVDVRITHLYQQTPGPGAGALLWEDES